MSRSGLLRRRLNSAIALPSNSCPFPRLSPFFSFYSLHTLVSLKRHVLFTAGRPPLLDSRQGGPMNSSGFRDLYGPGGPEGYYRDHADDYRNPHEPAVIRAVAHAVEQWSLASGRQAGIDFSRFLDLAAGGGELTLALLRLVPSARV